MKLQRITLKPHALPHYNLMLKWQSFFENPVLQDYSQLVEGYL